MKYTVVVVVDAQQALATLVDEKQNVVAVSDAVGVRDIAQTIFGVVDDLCAQAEVDRGAISSFDVQSALGDSAITQRSLRTVARVFEGMKSFAPRATVGAA